jgi:hypothetical protein
MGQKQHCNKDSRKIIRLKDCLCRECKHVSGKISILACACRSQNGTNENGEFLQNKNAVPQNVITVKYILHAYDVSYTTFKRMENSSAFISEPKVHKSKGKSVIMKDKAFAESFYFLCRMYLKLKFAQWQDTEVDHNADIARKKVRRRRWKNVGSTACCLCDPIL